MKNRVRNGWSGMTRRRALQALSLAGIVAIVPGGLWLSGCGGSNPLLGQYFSLSPTRIVVPIGGYGWVRVLQGDGHNQPTLYRSGVTLPTGVSEINLLGEGSTLGPDLGALTATAAATPGRYLATLRLNTDGEGAIPPQDEPFEVIVVPEGHGVGLTIGNPGTVRPGSNADFPITVVATQRVRASEWRTPNDQVGFVGDVRFRVDGLPAGVMGAFNQPTVTLGEGPDGDRGSEVALFLTVTVPAGMAPGSYPFTVLADHGEPVRTASIAGTLVVGAATATPTPGPTATPRPTPTPSPTPSPTPGPTTTGLVFSDVLAPVNSQTMDREATYTLTDGGRVLSVLLEQSNTVYRRIDLQIHSDTPIVPGTTAQVLYNGAARRASFVFTQQGGTPYYQMYRTDLKSMD